ncbi:MULTISPECIES: hypothetical protein [Francisella]|nr:MULTISPECIES: hypothetical protein [Francisella]
MKRILCRLFICFLLLMESNYSWALIGKLSLQNDNLKLVTKDR